MLRSVSSSTPFFLAMLGYWLLVETLKSLVQPFVQSQKWNFNKAHLAFIVSQYQKTIQVLTIASC